MEGVPAVGQFKIQQRAAVEGEVGQHAMAKAVNGENRRAIER